MPRYFTVAEAERLALRLRQFKGDGKPHIPGDVLRPGSTLAFLPATGEQLKVGNAAADVEDAGSLRPAELVEIGRAHV
mgnify:CR=1 FL=1